MSSLAVPAAGLTLGPIPQAVKGASEGLQALRLNFVDGAMLEEALKQGADLKITCGKSMVWVQHVRNGASGDGDVG